MLIDHIEKRRVHSELWQFQMGGGREGVHLPEVSTCFLYALVFPYIFLLFDCFLISSYYLTVSNGHSLTALKSKEFTLSSGSFKWGEGGREGLPVLPR